MESYFMLALLVVLGLLIGSFISVVTYRIPRRIGFIKGRSFCDTCKKELNWFDNIPIFYFLIYRGKSRCCGKPISIRYPLIELSTVIGFVLLFFIEQGQVSFVHYLIFIITLAIFVIDLERQIIPDELSWLVLLLGLLTVHGSLFTFLFSAFFFSLLLLILHLITGGRGMGLGDVKLAIPLGLILGLEKGFYWIMVSFILGGIVATVLLILGRAKLKTKIAFGPFLVIGFWLIFVISKLYK